MSGQMTKFNQNLAVASSMIGKEIEWNEYAQTGELLPTSGKVDSIIVKDGVQYAQVGAKNIKLDDIISISQGGESANG
jgi:flagellar basal-body rod modification protein FlgD